MKEHERKIVNMDNEATAPPLVQFPPPPPPNTPTVELTSSSLDQSTQKTKTTRSDSVLTTTTTLSSTTPPTATEQLNSAQDVEYTATAPEEPLPPRSVETVLVEAEEPLSETTADSPTITEEPTLETTEELLPETTEAPLPETAKELLLETTVDVPTSTEEVSTTAEETFPWTSRDPLETTNEPPPSTTAASTPSPPSPPSPITTLSAALTASLPPSPPPRSPLPKPAPNSIHRPAPFRRPRRPLTYKSHAALTHLTIPTNSSSASASNNSPFIYPPPAPRSVFLCAPEFVVQRTVGLRNAEDGAKEGEVVVEGVTEVGRWRFAAEEDEDEGREEKDQGREREEGERVEWVYRRKGRKASLRRVRSSPTPRSSSQTSVTGTGKEPSGMRVTLRDWSGSMSVLITEPDTLLRTSISSLNSTRSGSVSSTTSPTDPTSVPLIILTDSTDTPPDSASRRSSQTSILSAEASQTSRRKPGTAEERAIQQRIKLSASLLPTSRSSTKFTVAVPAPTLSPISPSSFSPTSKSPNTPASTARSPISPAAARTVTLKWRAAAPVLPTPPLSAAAQKKYGEMKEGVEEVEGVKSTPLLVLTMEGDRTAVAKIVLLSPPDPSPSSSSSASSPVSPKFREKSTEKAGRKGPKNGQKSEGNRQPTLALQLGPAVRVDGQAGFDARGHLVGALVDEGVVLATGMVVARRMKTGVVL